MPGRRRQGSSILRVMTMEQCEPEADYQDAIDRLRFVAPGDVARLAVQCACKATHQEAEWLHANYSARASLARCIGTFLLREGCRWSYPAIAEAMYPYCGRAISPRSHSGYVAADWRIRRWLREDECVGGLRVRAAVVDAINNLLATARHVAEAARPAGQSGSRRECGLGKNARRRARRENAPE